MPLIRRINKNFFKSWSSEMAYVLGFFFADGNLTIGKRGNHYISFYSSDRSLMLSIRSVMDSTHAISIRKSETGHVYRLQVGSKEIFSDLLELGLKLKKTKRLKLPSIPQAYFNDFLRGYFDGDGNVWMGTINKKRTKPTTIIQIFFTSGCREFLIDLRAQLQMRGIQGGSVFSLQQGAYWRLGLSTLDALKVYKIMYNVPSRLCLQRKKRIFDEFMKMRV